jgi:hypothetical protein
MKVIDTQLDARVRGGFPKSREKHRCTQVEEDSGRWIANQVKLRA